MTAYVLRLAQGKLLLAAVSVLGCSSQSGGPGVGQDAGGVPDGFVAGGESSPDAATEAVDGDGDAVIEAATVGPDDAPVPTIEGGSSSSGGGSLDAFVEAPAADAPTLGPICNQPCNHGTCLVTGGCSCDPNWAGAACDGPALDLSTDGGSVAGSVTRGAWEYFTYYGAASGLNVTLTETSTVGLVWVYLGTGIVPSQSSNLASDETASASHMVGHTFASSGTQTWYVAAYGQPAIPTSSQVVSFTVQTTVIP